MGISGIQSDVSVEERSTELMKIRNEKYLSYELDMLDELCLTDESAYVFALIQPWEQESVVTSGRRTGLVTMGSHVRVVLLKHACQLDVLRKAVARSPIACHRQGLATRSI